MYSAVLSNSRSLFSPSSGSLCIFCVVVVGGAEFSALQTKRSFSQSANAIARASFLFVILTSVDAVSLPLYF